MTDPMELVGRLENGSDRFLKWAYKEPYSGAPVISIPRHPDNIDALLTEAAACIREMVEQKEKLARRAERYREQVEVERKAYRNLLADHEGRTLPPAPGAEA